MATKTWTTKADWDAGTLDKLYCPIGLARLELAYDELLGKATYIFDGGANKKFNWAAFGHSKENTKTIWRDDFRANSISKYTLHSCPGWHDGTGAQPGYDAANKRLTINTGNDRGTTLEIPGLSIQNIKASFDVYIYGYYPTNAAAVMYVRFINYSNWYMAHFQSTAASEYYGSGMFKKVGGVLSSLGPSTERFPKNAWRTLIFEINGNELKSHTNEFTYSKTDGSLAAAGKVLVGCWQTIGYIGAVLVEHYTLPSPAGTSVSFKFWGGNDGAQWGCEHDNINDVPHSRYIKIEVSMTRQSLAKAMPVLKDMTVTYHPIDVQPIFF